MSVRHFDDTPHDVLDRLRAELRAFQGRDSDAWREQCQREIQIARRSGNGALVAQICVLAAAGSDAVGLLDEALAFVGLGLRHTDDPADLAHLWLLRAAMLATAGDLPGARDAVREAARLRPQAQSPRAQVEHAVYESVIAALALQIPSAETAHAIVAEAQGAGLDWLASGLVVWLVPCFAAHGLASATRPWVDWLEAQSALVQHRYRAEDAAAFRYTLALAEDAVVSPPAAPQLANAYARWRVLLAQLRDALVRGDRACALELVSQLETHVQRMNPGFRDGVAAFRALVDAYAETDIRSLAEPKAMTLVTLPAWLAGAEAVALRGTRAEAWRWGALLDMRLPDRIGTTLEWPVSAARVRALLALRAGDVSAATTLFQEAIQETGRRHAPIERAITLIQWEEVVVSGLAHGGPNHRAIVRAALELLSSCGVPGVLHARAAARVLESGPEEPVDRELTRREMQVLLALQDGRSYREIAEEMGIGWRTVQTHAHRMYRKLDVSSRRDAVISARSRGIL